MIEFKIFTNIVIATVFFIVANVLGGSMVAEASKKGGFELTILRDSLIKYLVILIVATLIYAGGYFGDEVLKGFTNEYINMKNLVSLGLGTYAVNRAADAAKHWKVLVNLKVNQEDEK